MPSLSSTQKDNVDKLTRIGSYRILKTLGEGAFAKVKLALHLITGEKVPLPRHPKHTRTHAPEHPSLQTPNRPPDPSASTQACKPERMSQHTRSGPHVYDVLRLVARPRRPHTIAALGAPRP